MVRLLKTAILSALAIAGSLQSLGAANPPRLIININVGSMNAEDLQRYAANFDGGLRKLLDEGAVFTDARYDCMQTVTPASLATLATGARPSTHGIVSERWFDYTSGRPENLTEDSREKDFDIRDGKPGHSARKLTTPTLSDMMIRADSSCRILSLAITPSSSIVQTGHRGFCFWIDSDRCRWTTSSYYSPMLPSWVKNYNADDLHSRYFTGQWTAKYDRSRYRNRRSTLLFAANPKGVAKTDFEKMSRTPAGNTAVLEFAKYAVKCLSIGVHNHTDILNICLDTAQEIAEKYGPESIEYEDMLYRLDADLKEFLSYMDVHLRSGSAVVVFTAAHGSSPAYDIGPEHHGRFNVAQFQVIMNAYLNAMYGSGDWVLGYSDRSLFLNHNLIDDKRLSMVEVQNEAAAFALRFRGVAHALSSAMLQSSYFARGYGNKMQNGFYPRRSGDVVIDLMPEWTEERDGSLSQSGSMYVYDTHVPLIFFGPGIPARRYDEEVDMTVVAPTLARIVGIGELPAAESKPLILD